MNELSKNEYPHQDKTSKRSGYRYTLEDCRRLLAEHKQSGLSGSQFCIERGINPSTFYSFRQRLERAESRSSFIELVPSNASYDATSTKCTLSTGDYQLTFPTSARKSVISAIREN